MPVVQPCAATASNTASDIVRVAEPRIVDQHRAARPGPQPRLHGATWRDARTRDRPRLFPSLPFPAPERGQAAPKDDVVNAGMDAERAEDGRPTGEPMIRGAI